MPKAGINIRKIHKNGRVSLGSYFAKLHIESGEYVVVEEDTTGVIKITPVRIEKKTFCKN
jgi:hypothetical protein